MSHSATFCCASLSWKGWIYLSLPFWSFSVMWSTRGALPAFIFSSGVPACFIIFAGYHANSRVHDWHGRLKRAIAISAGRADAYFIPLAGAPMGPVIFAGNPCGKFNEESLGRGWKTRNIGAALRCFCWWWKREIMTLKKQQWNKKKVKGEEEPLVRLRPLQGRRSWVQRSPGLWLEQT